MGVTIHYNGQLADEEKQRQLCREMVDICTSMEWQFHNVNPDRKDVAHPPVHGMFFMPHKNCEAVAILFDNAGNLVHISALAAYDPNLAAQKQVSVKTQFASPYIHIVIVKLLRYIKTKYIPALQVVDEGEYWAREDRDLLDHLFRVNEENIKRVAELLKDASGKWQPSESGLRLVRQIEDQLRALLKDDVDIKRLQNKPSKKDFDDWDISLN